MDVEHFVSEATGRLAALAQSGRLRGWSLKTTASRSHQRLYAAPDGKTLTCHQSRRVEGDAFQLSIYTPVEDPAQVGMALIDLVPFKPLDQQLAMAVELANGSKNRAWKLAGKPQQEPAPVETCDPSIRDNPKDVLARIEQQFADAFAATAGCRLNSAELFVNYSTSSLINSEGLAYSTEQSDLYLEAAMEKSGQANDKEVHEFATAVTVADLDVRGFIDGCALQVAVLGASVEPQTNSAAIILIGKEPLSQMIAALLQQLNCTNEYLKLPFLKPGDLFGGGPGDALEIRLDPALPCMVLSSAYAIDGLPARAGLLVEDNTAKERVIGNRFGQYLGLQPNGISGNILVAPGSLRREALQGTEYTEIIKFSSLLIDAQKLTWSSEIKLGRHVTADGTATLVKGGVVSGNLRDNFTACRLSAAIGTVNTPANSYAPALGYCGPDAMLITRGASIAGQTNGSEK